MIGLEIKKILLVITIILVSLKVNANNLCESLFFKEVADKKIRENKWAGYKQSVIDGQLLVPFVLNNRPVWVYDNANLSINVTHACNAKCGFCVDALRKKVSETAHVSVINIESSKRLTDTEEYLAQLEETLIKFKELNLSVSITGGEPTLDFNRLPGILRLLKKYSIRKRVLTTNGTRLFAELKNIPGKRMIDVITQMGLEHLNLSRAHYDEKINAKIMDYNNKTHLTNEEIKEAVRILNKAGIRVRLSVALLKDGINDITSIKKYLDWAKSIGVDNVIFRELMNFNKDEVEDNWVSAFYRKEGKPITIEDVLTPIDKDPQFQFVKQHVGYYYYVEIYKYHGVDVVFEASDLSILDNPALRRPNHQGRPIIYEMIMQDNANLEGTWQPGADILIPGKR